MSGCHARRAGCAGVQTARTGGCGRVARSQPARARGCRETGMAISRQRRAGTMSPKRRCNHSSRRNHRCSRAPGGSSDGQPGEEPGQQLERRGPQPTKPVGMAVGKLARSSTHAPRSCSPLMLRHMYPVVPETPPRSLWHRRAAHTVQWYHWTCLSNSWRCCASVRPLQNRWSCNVPTVSVACAQ